MITEAGNLIAQHRQALGGMVCSENPTPLGRDNINGVSLAALFFKSLDLRAPLGEPSGESVFKAGEREIRLFVFDCLPCPWLAGGEQANHVIIINAIHIDKIKGND